MTNFIEFFLINHARTGLQTYREDCNKNPHKQLQHSNLQSVLYIHPAHRIPPVDPTIKLSIRHTSQSLVPWRHSCVILHPAGNLESEPELGLYPYNQPISAKLWGVFGGSPWPETPLLQGPYYGPSPSSRSRLMEECPLYTF